MQTALTQAALKLRDIELLSLYDVSDHERCSRFEADNRETLDQVRCELRHLDPIQVEYTESWFAQHIKERDGLQLLAKSFSIRFQTEFREQRLDAAIQTGIDILDLANAIRHGGIIVDQLISAGVTGSAINNLRRLRDCINERQRRQIIEQLARVDEAWEPFESIDSRDQAFDLAVSGSIEGASGGAKLELLDPDECGLDLETQTEFISMFQELAKLPRRDREPNYHQADHHAITMKRLLLVDLAIRSSRERTGRLPQSLSDVQDPWVEELPVCPFSGRSFVYHAQMLDTFVLYSTGPTLVDHGGQFDVWLNVSLGLADLCLDENDYWPEHDCQPLPSLPRWQRWLTWKYWFKD